jgi:hypothetical protein
MQHEPQLDLRVPDGLILTSGEPFAMVAKREGRLRGREQAE